MSIHNLINDIFNAIGAGNKATHPISTAYTDGLWWVNIEVNSIRGTFDLETKAPSLEQALRTALKNVRRELR